MSNAGVIPNRLNWIDWAKALAITFVVFGHTPQELGSFPQNYIVTFHMPFFMFISGYLTKKEYFSRQTLRKYWRTLVVPYFCFNILFYPFWVLRYAIEHPHAGWYDYLKPVLGTFMMQCNSDYFEALNGVTWFIIALLVYKVILSVCNRYRYGHLAIVLLMVVSSVLFVVNEFYLFTHELTPISMAKCMAFFYIGYYCRRRHLLPERPHPYDWLVCVGGIGFSLICYAVYDDMDSMQLYSIRFWLVCLSATVGILYLCKLLDPIRSAIIENISVGTIVIMGLHFALIGTTNYLLEHLLGIESKIVYPWYVALGLCIVFEAMLYPLIILFKTKYPFVLGKTALMKP